MPALPCAPSGAEVFGSHLTLLASRKMEPGKNREKKDLLSVCERQAWAPLGQTVGPEHVLPSRLVQLWHLKAQAVGGTEVSISHRCAEAPGPGHRRKGGRSQSRSGPRIRERLGCRNKVLREEGQVREGQGGRERPLEEESG